MNPPAFSRRGFLAASAAFGGSMACAPTLRSAPAEAGQARIAITFDLEMSRNFPRWEDIHWDYEKGNLDDATKRYALDAARRVKSHGGLMHFFLVGRVLEQENVDWLKEIIAGGHAIGNHSYDHINVKAANPQELQARFRNAPWLAEGKTVPDIIKENIQMTSHAMKSRLGISPAGFRTPGGFGFGLDDRADLRRMLLDLGYKWISSKYPRHAISQPGTEPGKDVFESILKNQTAAQPYSYPDGLIELPMSPISDIGAFRTGRWKLESFLKAVRAGVEWAVEQAAVFDFLSHPSCLGVMDPEFRTIDLICDLVEKAGSRAKIVTLDQIAAEQAR